MSSNVQYFKETIEAGFAKEAADWARQIEPLLTEAEARQILQMLANEVLDPKERPKHRTFHGNRKLPADYGGVVRHVDQAEWERQIYCAVKAFDGTKVAAYKAVAEQFTTGEKNVEAIYGKLKKQAP